jgi:flagellar motor component MotA
VNKSSFVGFLIFGFLIMGTGSYVKTPDLFFNSQIILFVLGCTLAAALVAYPYASLSRTVDYLLWGLLFKKKKQYLKVSQEIAAARNSFFAEQIYSASDDVHPFFREASLFLMNRNIDDEALEEILRNRSDYFKKRYEEDAGVLRSLAKYPVSFGILSAITSALAVLPGIQNHSVDLVTGILQGAGGALIAVFWGMALANFLILPVADSAAKAADEDAMLRNLIIDGMVLIRCRATDDHFQAYLRGYLSLADRSEFKIFAKSAVPYANVPVAKKVVAAPPVQTQEASANTAVSITVPPPTSEVESSFPPGHVEESVSIASANPSNLTQFDFKDAKTLMAPKEQKSLRRKKTG